jgi:DNA-binding response OmpR family regulator
VMTEIPLVKQHLCDSLWAFAGQGAQGERLNRLTGDRNALRPRPSRAASIAQGYGGIARFFPGARDMLAAVEEALIDRVLGLKIGADDYVTKPFEMAELLARVEAQLRRTRIQPLSTLPATYQFGRVRVNFARAEVQRDGTPVALSALEFKLLQFLIKRRGDTLSRDQMLNEVWGYDAMPSTRTVDVHVAGLRQKLEENPRHPQFILTAHGLGYKFVG